MRTIRIIAVGKIKQSGHYLVPGLELYEKRLSRHLKIDWVEVPEQPPSPTQPVEKILERETEAILKHCDCGERITLLSEQGRLMNSPEFSQWLFGGIPLDGGRGVMTWDRMIFIVGGAYGTSQRLNQQVTDVISLSSLTFPHQMVRLILLEQIYRAHTILNNEPYHK